MPRGSGPRVAATLVAASHRRWRVVRDQRWGAATSPAATRSCWRRGGTALAFLALTLCAAPSIAQEDAAAEVPPAEPPLSGASETGAPIKGRAPLFPDSEPLPDRWRITPPPYQRNVQGHWWDPYNQNILKGDYPILGQDIFAKLTAATKIELIGRSAPTPSGVSTVDPGEFRFFGNNEAFVYDQKWAFKGELQQGNTSFRPFDWQIVLEGVIDLNDLTVWENGVVSPDVRDGTSRLTHDAALQQASLEYHILNLSSRYDFVSVKVGRQPFNSDFRSLIFFDFNQGGRLFGSAGGNRYQWNLLYFYQAETDIFSDLNTFDLRHQSVGVANLYVQDLLVLGWQNELSLHVDYDDGAHQGLVYDEAGFLVRPDPVGIATPHTVEAYYLGWASEGHIDRINVSHAFYQALGHDTNNPIAGRPVDINGQLAFLELSLDQDWLRYQTSVFFSSGDSNPRDGQATGFDTILDFPRIMGGEFSYWNRQPIRIGSRGNVNLVQANSVVPDLRSSKAQGQANFVNPGLLMVNVGASAELTQKLRAVSNVNYIRFIDTQPLEILLKQPNIRNDVGLDLSLGLEYRPLLNNNIIIKTFGAILQPFGGFMDIYQSSTLFQAGTEVTLVF